MFLDYKAKLLDYPITAKGYDSIQSCPITHYMLIDLVINRQRLVEMSFLILQLGNQDMILRAK